MLRASSETAELYLRKETLAADAVRHLDEREQFREQKAQLAEEAQRLRAKIRKLETKLHAKELAAGEVRHERTALADRLRDDYGIELEKIEQPVTAAELNERAAIEQEIAELRAKINNIGGVNLDALAELEELEARFALLSSQHADLSTAKASLEQIIGKINADSRRCSPRRWKSCAAISRPCSASCLAAARPTSCSRGRRHSGKRHRDHRPAARQGAAQHFALERRRKDAHLRGLAVGDFPQPAQPLLRARRSGRGAGRSQHRTLHRGAHGSFWPGRSSSSSRTPKRR